MNLREKFFEFMGNATANKYWIILLIGLIATLILGGLSENLKLEMTWLSMVPKDAPKVKEYKSIVKNFKSAAPIVIAIEGNEVEKMEAVTEKLARELKKNKKYIKDVRYKTDIDFFKKYGLLLQKEKNLKRFKNILKNFNLSEFFKNLNNDFEKEYIEESDEPLAKQEKNASMFLLSIEELLKSFNKYIPTEDKKILNKSINKFSYGDKYFISPDKKMILLFVIPEYSIINIENAINTARSVEKILSNFKTEHPDLKFGQTGMHTITKDEMEAGTHDTIFNLITAIIIILALFIISFRMFSSPFLAMITLLIGVTWTLGITYLLIGKLNLMTAMVGVILIGLGIDYSIHLISGFTQAYYRTGNYKESFKETFLKVGPGILTGALTTAVAFLVFIFVKIGALKELGLVLGIGIICTFLSAIFLLPSLIILKDKIKKIFTKKNNSVKNVNMELKFMEEIGKRATAHPYWIIIITLLLTVVAIFLIPQLYFTGDLKRMEAKGLISLKLMDKVIEKYDMSTDAFVFTVNNLKRCEEKTDRLNKFSSVGFVESLSLYLPSEEKQNSRLKGINEIKNILNNQPSLISVSRHKLIKELRRLEANIIELSDMAYMSGLDRIVKRCDEIANLKDGKKAGENIFDSLIKKIKTVPLNRLNQLQKIFASGLKKNYLSMCSARKLTMKDVPEDIKNIYLSKDGKKYLVSVYPAKDVWKEIYDSKFLEDVTKVSKKATGMPVFMYLLIQYTKESGAIATLLALVVIFLIVLIDFKNLKFALISLLPLIIGSIWTLAFLVITDFQLTYMTIMVVPLIIGIGIDDGVHIIHRYRIEGENSLPLVLRTTGKAIVLTSITTMVAFGSLAFSRMVGYQQVGITLFAGIGFLLILSTIFLPAVLKLLEK